MIPAAAHHEGYRAEIDGLRAIAVMAVIVAHAGPPFSSLIPGGFLGVDVFFVISGYLITGILLRDLQNDKFSIYRFYERRTRRILPALLFVLLVSIPVSWAVMSPPQMEHFSRSLVGIAFFASNFYFWLTSGYFSIASEVLPMIHTWSLAVEEQYYFVFPIALLFLWRRNQLFVGLSIALILGLILAELMARTMPSAAFYLAPARTWELLAGSLAGYCVNTYGLPDGSNGPKLWRTLGRYRSFYALLGLCGILAAMLVYHPGLPLPGFWLIPVIISAVFVLLCTHQGSLTHKILTLPPMIWIGLTSYSAYLWHQPVFAFYRLQSLDEPSPLTMILLTGIVLLLAWVSWYFIEQPFRASRISFAPIAAGLGALMSLILVFGLAGHVTSGFGLERFSPSVMAVFQTARPSPMRAKCHSMDVNNSCTFFGSAPSSLAVIGDSHGVEIAYALAENRGSNDVSVEQFTQSGCPPALNFETNVTGCRDWTNAVVERLENYDRHLTIFLAYRHSAYLFGKNDKDYPKLPNHTYGLASESSEAEKRALYWESFETIISRLRAVGHDVVLVQPVPEIARSVGALTMHNIRIDSELGATAPFLIPAVPRSYYEARSGAVREKLKALAEKDQRITLLDSAEAFCDEIYCYAAREGKAFYFDDNHPSVDGALSIVGLQPR